MNSASGTTRKIVIASMLAALTCVATMVIKIPSPMKGYLNLGDCVALLSGWLLPPMYGALAAGIGSALADLFSGYVSYVPATFVIKALMALCACFLAHRLSLHLKPISARAISGIAAEIIMVLSYLAFESLLYGFLPSAVNVLPNAIQGIVGLILGLVLARVFDSTRLLP